MKRIKYWTMNSWNLSTAPAYNLKVYNVIPEKLQNKVFELMDCEDFYHEITKMMHDFNHNNNFEWQAGFNGRSGGYLVLYKGGRHDSGTIYSKPGLNIDEKEVPIQVLKDFKSLANAIVKYTINLAKNAEIKDEVYFERKTRKVII